ncbi:hypothetical protein KP509_13G065000 [Ceratopteris richardii]|uniref:Thioredoxin domain-containing protein n=1 Tax=Ceratopteris richardii TaxID=49495 RepID=A0A8T2TID4_CERRI|nr:hypothetical protein KP509_13G065000 [Ceratopteris richardii]
MNNLMIELSEYYLTLTFIKFDLPVENNDLSGFMTQMGILELPTFIFYYHGKQVFRLVGAFVDELVHLTHSLYTRQILTYFRDLNREIHGAMLTSQDQSVVEDLRDELCRIANGVGNDLWMYESIGLLQ